MRYNKPPLSFEAQVDLLHKRGMVGEKDLMVSRLRSVNYYRLSGYWHTYRKPNASDAECRHDDFQDGTLFTDIWNRYAFDRRLRVLVMDAIERIEVTVKTALAYHHSHNHGIFAYADDPSSMPKLSSYERADYLKRINEECGRSKEVFYKHFQRKYSDEHKHLPIWMATEIMSFGSVLTFYRGASHQVKQNVATIFGLPDKVFDSWLLALNAVRNICAHHSRLWNRELGVKPIIPRLKEYPDWHTPVKIENNKLFCIVTICRHSLHRIAPQSKWPERLKQLFNEYHYIPKTSMGFPVNWDASPIWV